MTRRIPPLEEIVPLSTDAGIYQLDGGSRTYWQPERLVRKWFARKLRGLATLLHLRHHGS